MRNDLFKFVAKAMLVTLSYQLVFPACAYALTTGPSQPEVQSFEPVGTTEMVDMFTGDFNYNIPLMDVEGYPINIFYHSGVGVEQEASWVGLGWNINPGEINRTVRGLPDDFNGDKIEKYIKIKEEKELRIGIGADAAIELFGKDFKEMIEQFGDKNATSSNTGFSLGAGLGVYIVYNNYRGISSGVNTSTSISTPIGSTGINLGIGTQTGADIDMYASLKTPDILGKASFGVSANGGVGYNSRTGLKDISFGLGAQAMVNGHNKSNTINARNVRTGASASTTIPIGLQNYVPVITTKMSQNSIQLQTKLGMSSAGITASAYVQGMRSVVSYNPDATRAAYGYLNLQNAAGYESILDFSREKDGVYNATLKNLPLGGLTYDVYSVNGHGTGGMFRPYRNDIGTIYDPYVSPEPSSVQSSNQLEYGVPGADYGEFGDDFTKIESRNESGPWNGAVLPFSKNSLGSLFENVFFKQAGELTYNQQQEQSQIFNNSAQYLNDKDLSTLKSKGNTISGFLPFNRDNYKILSGDLVSDRTSRSTNISYQTAEQIMKVPEMDLSKKITNYKDGTNFYNPIVETYNRFGTNVSSDHLDKKHHVSEFTQTTPDGRRYVYGIPALNNITKEVTMAIDENGISSADIERGYVSYNSTQNSAANISGKDNFYSSTITPTYAHSYLLTALLSSDYVDILGDGPTDDDLGTYVKYNYTLKNKDYRWKTPYPANTAQYNPGFWSDDKDGKGNYLIGSRQQWYVRTIETKNYVAEFYTSARKDARGVKEIIDPSKPGFNTLAASDESFALDSIKLFNKHDRYINKDDATPIKTVIFNYDYSLCKGIPNTSSTTLDNGKLTLKKIYIKYGNSQKNLLSPYVFEYNGSNPVYDFAAKDRWGNYKKVVHGNTYNYEFPYTEQPNDEAAEIDLNNDLSAWNLTDIKLPSGGKIHLEYESDDYSFVQNKRSMQMLKIVGVGNSPKLVIKDRLYNDKDNINDYVYFKRSISKENPSLSLKENYLEGQDLLYYSFSVDVAGVGKYEAIKGYAKIEEVNGIGICEGNTEYAYIKLKREPAKKMMLHPVSLLGINTGRYHLPHIFYDGYSNNGFFDQWLSLAAKVPELLRTIFGENPFKEFIRRGKARNIVIANSWIRLNTPGLTKKGGGIRVKKLELSDNWKSLSGNEDASYGKLYDYTINHDRYGLISSGVASYEPMIGADENPFRQPIPYSAESGRGIPSVDFFQEEPFGESLFPSATVGYSSVKVKSIHHHYGRSAQALDEYLFYTAKDYPIIVDYTEKNADEQSVRKLNEEINEAKILQGYCIQLNDMHGKPKAVNNYVTYQNSGITKHELITGSKYNYNENEQHQLDNKVKALVRVRGSQNAYEIKDVLLGQEMDFTVDSRSRTSQTFTKHTAYNLNALQVLGVPVPVPTMFKPKKENLKIFKSLVTTKVIQRYGIIKSIEAIDHGAKTITENLVYDSETGNPILTRTNNEFNQYSANLTHPAYLAYEGMRPAYTNDGYEEIMDSLVINYDRDGYLYTNNFDRFTEGDELLVESKSGQIFKLWVLGTGIDNSVAPPILYGSVSFAKILSTKYCNSAGSSISITIFPSGSTTTPIASGIIKDNISDPDKICNNSKAFNKELPVGSYTYTAIKTNGITSTTETGSFVISEGKCTSIQFNEVCPPDFGYVYIKKEVIYSSYTNVCFFPDFIKLVYHLYPIPPFNPYSVKVNEIGTLIKDSYNRPAGPSIGDYPIPARTQIGDFACLKVPVGKYHLELNTFGSPDHWGTKYQDHPIGYDFEVKKDKSVNYLYRCDQCGEGVLEVDKTPTCAEPTNKLPTEKETNNENSLSEKTPKLISFEGSIKRCGLIVSPRFKDKISGTTNLSTWPLVKTKFNRVRVKVLRSGRRNNLSQTIQQTNFIAGSNNFDFAHVSTLSNLFNKRENILSASVSTFTDATQMYAPFLNEMDIVGDYKYAKFNPYVLGLRGNFRPLASYAPITKRQYTYTDVKRDGSFRIPNENQFWSINNGSTVPTTICAGPTDLFSEKTRTGPPFWKMASKITRYDIFGNALEEQDAIGNYSSAQYGYNKSLPVSVASNAQYQQFMFDGFEDYNMLLPEKISSLFLKGDLYSAFGLLFGNSKAGSSFTTYSQNYHLRDMAPGASSIVLSNEANHTGFYSLKANSATSFVFSTGDALANELGAFKFSTGKKYLIQLWAKSAMGTAITGTMFSATTPCITQNMEVKTGNIDGWYQLQAIIDLTSVCGSTLPTVSLQLPANVYIDDLRALPIKSNMKSFVYDPLNFKLVAQLDENHMATFFEYDQEGLLVRTKKETSNGVVTISESRKSNRKK